MKKFKSFLTAYGAQFLTFVTVVVIFTHNVLFDRHFSCTCTDQTRHCDSYIAVPVLIIVFWMLWTDRLFRSSCRYCYMGRFCCTILLQFIKASLVGALWVVSVLIDGGWYVCCLHGLNGDQAQIPCRSGKNQTAEERVIIENLQNESKMVGFLTLFGILVFAVAYTSVRWRKCCSRRNATHPDETLSCCQRTGRCFTRELSWHDTTPYELVLLQEHEEFLEQVFIQKAKEELNHKIQNKLNSIGENKYDQCFDAAEELIEELRRNVEGGLDTESWIDEVMNNQKSKKGAGSQWFKKGVRQSDKTEGTQEMTPLKKSKK